MKKLLTILFITRILITPLLASKILFIQDFQNNTTEKKYDQVGKSLADMVISDIVALQVDGVEVVERARIKSLISELKLQESEYFDQSTTQKMGKGLGANYALAGSFTVINGVMRIDARLINITTSKIHSSFKTKGDEEAIFDLEAELVKNIGKGLEIDFGDVSRDKLSSPKELGTLVKYADADKLIEQGDYKAATKALGEVAKSEPEFKLGKEAYKEAMRKLYAAREKRDTSFLDNIEKLQASALEKRTEAIKAKDSERELAYSIVLTEIYFLRLQKIGGLPRHRSSWDEPLSANVHYWQSVFGRHLWLEYLEPFRSEVPPVLKALPEDKMQDFRDALDLYIETHLSCINQLRTLVLKEGETRRYKFFRFCKINGEPRVDAEDWTLMKSMPLKWEMTLPDRSPISALQLDLAHFLLFGYDFSPAPYLIDKKYAKLGWELLDQARRETLGKQWPMDTTKEGYREKYARKIIDMHGELLLAHDETVDAIIKWQEILDEYPNCEEFEIIENKIKEALK